MLSFSRTPIFSDSWLQRPSVPSQSTDNMVPFAPTPIFSGSWNHRPVVPSPLSSSPIRASSPLSPIDNNTLPQRQVQSSPIPPSKFKFASRPSRPNPVVRKREEVYDGRRRLFLQNVRQKSDDKAWQRRDIEGQFLKTNWLEDQGQLSHDAPDFSEADIDDAAAFLEEGPQPQDDDMMLDDILADEFTCKNEEELYSEAARRPPSPALSDEEFEFDDVFAELILKEQLKEQWQNYLHQDDPDQMDTTGGMDDMPS
ncbi:hypothetical protein G7046_g1121 [Stylonectria norvegica]|nr:hypothetical protein G7046_g1121 [Stylonectria norvegica]